MCKYNADLKELAGAPEHEIEVTPAMVEAGFDYLRANGLSDLEVDLVTRNLVRGFVGKMFLTSRYRLRLI